MLNMWSIDKVCGFYPNRCLKHVLRIITNLFLLLIFLIIFSKNTVLEHALDQNPLKRTTMEHRSSYNVYNDSLNRTLYKYVSNYLISLIHCQCFLYDYQQMAVF